VTGLPIPAEFHYKLHSARIVFGDGALGRAAAELNEAGLTRAFVVATSGRSTDLERLVRALGTRVAGVFTGATLHVPAAVVADARRQLDESAADCCVTLGGGSATGLGKALALQTGLPLVAIPTTYAGSEMTEIWGITERDAKATGRSARVAPLIVIYDPGLTLTLPAAVSAASGMNAAAHAVEALYAPDANPVASLLAEQAIRWLAQALPAVVRSPMDREARSRALCAAHFAGVALNATSMGLHHKLCHVLGGSFGLPHAPTHAAVLPYVAAYNRDAAGDALAVVARALEAPDAARGLRTLNQQLGLTATLADLGLAEADIDRAAELATRSTYPNPRPVTTDGVRAILRAAFDGADPG
jgi:alcohol dehydrogenase class IV